MKINEKIKELRIENKLTQKEFANKTGLAISTIQKYEYGDLTPSESVLFKICKIFNIDISYFLSNKTNDDFKRMEDFNDQMFKMVYEAFKNVIIHSKPFENSENIGKRNYNPALSKYFETLKKDGYDVVFSINNLAFSININEFYNELTPFIEFLLYKHSMPVKVVFADDKTIEDND